MNKKYIILFVILLVFLVSPDLLSQGCSQCKLKPQSDLAGGGTAAKGINYAILYLMAIPYVVLMIFFRKRIVSFYRTWKRKPEVGV